MTEAVFLDKDGTLVQNDPYNVRIDKIKILPGVPEGLALLARAGFKLIVVSNQAGVALGRFEASALRAVQNKLAAVFKQSGAALDGFYCCPHHPQGVDPAYRRDCHCRKPRAGLLLQARRELGLDLERSWLIGDILDDVEAGRRAGCRTVLIDNGNETEWKISPERVPDFQANNFLEACRLIRSQISAVLKESEGIA